MALPATAALLVAGAALGPRAGLTRRGPDLSFRRLTFKRGWVSEARFAERGKSVVYSATWGGTPTELFSIRLPGTDSIPLGVSMADLLAVSPSGELALRRNPLSPRQWFFGVAQMKMKITLATVPLAGGTPKDVAEAVFRADYAPDGTMAVARDGEKGGIEYPFGSDPKKVRPVAGLGGFRISRDGRLLAFHARASDGTSSLVVLQPDGTQRPLTKFNPPALGLAWSPNGDEVWYAERNKLRAVSLSGRVRNLYTHTTNLRLQDVAPDGRVLVTAEDLRQRFFFRREGDASERELSWLDDSLLCDLSPDGKFLTFFEQGIASEGLPVSYRHVSYVRETSGAPPMRIGEGAWPRLSPDGRFVVVAVRSSREIVVHPIGAGAVRTVKVPGHAITFAGLLSDGQGIWFVGTEEATNRQGVWVTDPDGSKARLVTPDGYTSGWPPVAPDARYVAATWKGGWWLFPLSGGEPRPLPGIQPNEVIAGFGPDTQWVYVSKRFELPLRIFRVDLRTGNRKPVREIVWPDRSGVGISGVALRISRDGRSYASGFDQQLSDLYLVEGLR